jgi:hypothetical protein
VTAATVYFDHPQHAPAEHTLNVDFINPAQGPSARLAVELTPASARALAQAILASLPEDPDLPADQPATRVPAEATGGR